MSDLQSLLGVSVLICTYNGSPRLVQTLKYLAKQIIVNQIPWEVILVDNNSTDDTQALSLREWTRYGNPAPLRILSQSKPGKQFALEMAYDAAQFEFMCIVDDDNWLNPHYLQIGFDILSTNSQIGILGGSNKASFEVDPPLWFSDFQASYAVGKPKVVLASGVVEAGSGEVISGALWGAGMFIRRTIWFELQALEFKSTLTGRQGESQLTAGEDDEICYLALLLGYKIWHTDSLLCIHYMTSRRLTVEYLKGLCYASSLAYPKISAYQRVLSQDWKNYYSFQPWLKDWVYMVRTAMRSMITIKYLKTFFINDSVSRIRANQQIFQPYLFIKNFRELRRNFLKVAEFRELIKKR